MKSRLIDDMTLQQIESKIKSLVGNIRWWRHATPEFLDEIEGLLHERRKLLNEAFVPDETNLQRLNAVNNHMFHLTMQLKKRVDEVYAKKELLLDAPDFDDDYEIEGTLKFVYNDESSVLTFEDDSIYGSDFQSMIETIYEFHATSGPERIEWFSPGSELLDDGESWNEYPFRNKVYDGITICHAVHDLCDHKLYSIPDLLRLNDFWAEVHFRIQSITEQSGKRYQATRIFNHSKHSRT